MRLTFCRAFRGGGENFSGDSSTRIKIVSPSGGLSNCRRKSSTAVGSSFTGGSFRAGIVEVQEGTLGGARGGSLKQPALLDADGGEGRLITSRGGAWAAAWHRFFSLRLLLRRFWGLPWRYPRFWASGVATTVRMTKTGM